MKLTRLQRHTAYILMLAEYESSRHLQKYGLCHLISYLTDDGISFHRAMDSFCELKRKKPKKPFNKLTNLWFWYDTEGIQKRKDILKQCISETY